MRTLRRWTLVAHSPYGVGGSTGHVFFTRRRAMRVARSLNDRTVPVWYEVVRLQRVP